MGFSTWCASLIGGSAHRRSHTQCGERERLAPTSSLGMDQRTSWLMELPLGKRLLVVRLARPEPSGPPPVADSTKTLDTDGDRRDLVRKHSKKMAFGLFVLAACLLVGSLDYGVREGLPSVALDWLFGLQVIRAGLAFAIIAVVVLLIVRGWGGMWPENFLTTGVGYPAEKAVEGGIARAAAVSAAARRELETLLTAERRE